MRLVRSKVWQNGVSCWPVSGAVEAGLERSGSAVLTVSHDLGKEKTQDIW